MTVLEKFAESLVTVRAAPFAAALSDKVALHLFDTVGALVAGGGVSETAVLAEAIADGEPADAAGRSVWAKIAYATASARATEIDDIHLGACVTPSAIVVPVALIVARHLGVARGDSVGRACLAGYEAMIRFGRAVDGPELLGRGIWPTHLCAGIGAAAAAASLMELPANQLAHALGLCSAVTAFINARGDAPTARWAPIGLAAANGVFAGMAARRGLKADLALLDGRWSRATGVALDGAVLDAPLSGGFAAAGISLKPWCGARQTMAAGAGFGALLEEAAISPDSLHEVVVEVPDAYRAMIDHSHLLGDRQESFADLRYTLGLIAFAPDVLFDVERRAPHRNPRIEALARKIRIVADPALARHYPLHWPARITLVAGDGKRYQREVIAAPGDPGTDYGWDAISAKFARVTGLGESEIGCLRDACRALPDGDLAAVLATIPAAAGIS